MIFTTVLGMPATHWLYISDGGWIATSGQPDDVADGRAEAPNGRHRLGVLPLDTPPKDGLLSYRTEPYGPVLYTRAEEFTP